MMKAIDWKNIIDQIAHGYIIDILAMKNISNEIIGFYVQLTTGGPEIFLITYPGFYVEAWGDETTIIPIPEKVCEKIDDILKPLFS